MDNYFTNTMRGEERIVTLRDDAPEWVSDAVREAHDGEMPDDWRYDICESIFEEIDPEDDDRDFELADGLVDVYNNARVAWLAGDLGRASYCDEAADEYGIAGDTFDRLGWGQLYCINQMVGVIRAAIEANEED